MKLKWNKTLKISTALLASVGLLGVSTATIVSCASTTPDPDQDVWTWEKYAQAQALGGDDSHIDPSIPKIDSSLASQAEWTSKTEILLADWQRDFPTAQYIAANTFDYTNFPNLEYIEIPNTIRSIENNAFLSNNTAFNHLKKGIKMADSVVNYGNSAFCRNKTAISLSATIISIGSTAFLGANLPTYTVVEGVKKIIFPNSLWYIWGRAFDNLIMNNSDTIQLDFSRANNLRNIGGGAFWSNPNIVGNIKYPAKVKKLDLSAFKNTGVESISIDKSVTNIELIKNTWFPSSLSIECPSLKTLTLPVSCQPIIEADDKYYDDAINYVYF